MKLGAETIEQIKVVNWIRQCTTLPVLHIAGERKCSPQYGAILKRMGTRAGVSDIFIPRAVDGYHGAWIELKTITGRATPAQIAFLEDMEKEGYHTAIAYGAEQCIAIIRDFYSI